MTGGGSRYYTVKSLSVMDLLIQHLHCTIAPQSNMCTCMTYYLNNWCMSLKTEKIQLSVETGQNSDEYRRWQYSTDSHMMLGSFREGSLVMGEALRSSGFDVREACVGLTAAGRCAEVSRATAFCYKHTHIEDRCQLLPVVLLNELLFWGSLFEYLSW